LSLKGSIGGMANWLGFLAVVILFGAFAFALWWLLKLAQNEVGWWGPVLIAPPCLITAWLVDRKIFRAWQAPDEESP
jgi:hypothetical protein